MSDAGNRGAHPGQGTGVFNIAAHPQIGRGPSVFTYSTGHSADFSQVAALLPTPAPAPAPVVATCMLGTSPDRHGPPLTSAARAWSTPPCRRPFIDASAVTAQQPVAAAKGTDSIPRAQGWRLSKRLSWLLAVLSSGHTYARLVDSRAKYAQDLLPARCAVLPSPLALVMAQELEREPYPLTRQSDYPDRGFRQDARLQSARSLPKSIPKALREDCHINSSNVFFLWLMTDDNRPVCFTGSNKIPLEVTADFFDSDKFLEYQSQPELVPDPSRPTFKREPHQPQSFRGCALRPGSRSQALTGEQEYPWRTRKRPRHPRGDAEIPIMSARKPLLIGDTSAVADFYGERFRNCQQTACKLIAKAWIKVVEPRKQSNYPYTGSTPPSWWPAPWDSKDGKVRHKEPDHLLKKERVSLLKHILGMVVLPMDEQHQTVKDQQLNVAKLEEITMDALSGFFSDPSFPNNAKKKPFLTELFHIAKADEQWRNGEIDGDTEFFVMADDRAMYRNQSDDDDIPIKEEETYSRDVSERALSPRSVTAGLPPSTTSSVTAAQQHHMLASANAAHGPVGGLQHGGGPQHFLADLAVRDGGHQYVPPIEDVLGASTTLQPHGTMVMGDMISPHHDQSRRSSLFSSPSDFTPASTPTPTPSAAPMYRWGAGGTAASSGAAGYSLAQPQGSQPQQQQNLYRSQHYVPQQPYLDGGGFQGLPRGYEAGLGGLFRGGAPPMGPPHGSFSGYSVNHDDGESAHGGVKLEPHLGPGLLH